MGKSAFRIDIDVFSPDSKEYRNGIISLVATDAGALAKGVNMLMQVIQLGFEEYREAIASLWIRDWE